MQELVVSVWDPQTEHGELLSSGVFRTMLKGGEVLVEGESSRLRAWAADLVERIDIAERRASEASHPSLLSLPCSGSDMPTQWNGPAA